MVADLLGLAGFVGELAGFKEGVGMDLKGYFRTFITIDDYRTYYCTNIFGHLDLIASSAKTSFYGLNSIIWTPNSNNYQSYS